MSREIRAACSCGWESEWLNRRFSANAEGAIHAREHCGGTVELESRRKPHYLLGETETEVTSR